MGSLVSLEDWAEGLTPIPRDIYTVSINEDDREEFLFKCDDHPFIARGCLQCLAGKPESGKSTVGICFLALCLSGKYDFLETTDGKPIKALWFDTEQDRKRVVKKYRQVFENAAIPIPSENEAKRKLHVVSLLQCMEPEEMLKVIEQKVKTVRPGFVFLDGVADLVEDFNSVAESRNVIRKLLHLATTYNCAIMCVIHLNKGASLKEEDIINGLQGVLGSKLAQKVQEGFALVRSEYLTTLFNAKSRNDYGRLKEIYVNATMGEHQIITISKTQSLGAQIDNFEKEETQRSIIVSAIKKTEEKGMKPNFRQLKITLESSFQIKGKRADLFINNALDKHWIYLEETKGGALYRISEEAEKPKEDTEEEPL